MEELKLSNEQFIPSKRKLKLGKLKDRPIELQVGKKLNLKLNRISDPIELFIDEISLCHEYPMLTVNIKLIDTKYTPSRFINEETLKHIPVPKIYIDEYSNLCVDGKIIGGY